MDIAGEEAAVIERWGSRESPRRLVWSVHAMKHPSIHVRLDGLGELQEEGLESARTDICEEGRELVRLESDANTDAGELPLEHRRHALAKAIGGDLEGELEADSRLYISPESREVQKRLRLLGCVGGGLEIGSEGPVKWRQHSMGRVGMAAISVGDDRAPVDGERERLADPRVGQDSFAQVEPEIGECDGRPRMDTQRLFAFQPFQEDGGDACEEDVGASSEEREESGPLVGDDPKHEPAYSGGPEAGLLAGFENDLAVGVPRHEAKRARTDESLRWKSSAGVHRVARDDAEDQVREECRVGAMKLEDDAGGIRRVAMNVPKSRCVIGTIRGLQCRVEDGAIRPLDIFGRERMAVMESNSGSERHDLTPGVRRIHLDAAREVQGGREGLVVDRNQRGEHHAGDVHRGGVDGEAGIESLRGPLHQGDHALGGESGEGRLDDTAADKEAADSPRCEACAKWRSSGERTSGTMVHGDTATTAEEACPGLSRADWEGGRASIAEFFQGFKRGENLDEPVISGDLEGMRGASGWSESNRILGRFSLLVCLLVVGVVFDAPSAHADMPRAAVGKLEKTLQSIGKIAQKWGVSVVDVDSGDEWFVRHGDTPFNVASNAKLISTAAALSVLGTQRVFETRLEGTLNDAGVVQGDLHVIGGGDPMLDVEGVKKLVERAHAAGVREVKGRLMVDDSLFDAEHVPPAFAQKSTDAAYRASVGALSVSSNAVTISFRPDRKMGEAPIISVSPRSAYILLDNAATTGEGKKDRLLIETSTAGTRTRVRVSGRIGVRNKGGAVTRRIEDPGVHAGHVIRAELVRRGIPVRGAEVVRGRAPKGMPVLATHAGEPLAEVARFINERSHNMGAETLFKHMGVQEDASATWSRARIAVTEFMRGAGLDPGTYTYTNGSGLYEAVFFSPRQLTQFLVWAHKESPWRDAWLSSLAVAGRTGTLRGRMRGEETAGKVRGKTGTLNKVIALSGYLETATGRHLAFSFLFNELKGGKRAARRLQDRLCMVLATF